MDTRSEKDSLVMKNDGGETWRQYPSNFALENTSINSQNYFEKVSDRRSDIFSSSPLLSLSRRRFRDGEALDSYISTASIPDSRIISLHSQNSLDTLKVTEDSLLRLLSHHEVGPEFLDLLFAFGGKPQSSDVGIGGLRVNYRPDGSYDMTYLMVYAEESRDKERNSWPIRQTAVFHRFVPDSVGNLWIFVHPMPNSTLQQRIEAHLLSEGMSHSAMSMYHLHLLAISSYIDAGRWYLRSLSDEFEDIADVALTLDFSRPNDYTEGFKTLTKLQYLQERILPLPARLETSSFTVKELQSIYSLFQSLGFYDDKSARGMSNGLSSFNSKYRSNLAGVELLRSRVQGVIKLLSVALNLKNQATSVDINHNMLLLTKDTVDDSATVRVVTLVTLIYLPASFISSLLGTNLFAFESANGSGFQISKQFWIFIALSVPLTFLTVGSWFYISYKRRRNKVLQERSRQFGSCAIEV